MHRRRTEAINYTSGLSFSEFVILLFKMLEKGVMYDSSEFTLIEIESILYSFNEVNK